MPKTKNPSPPLASQTLQVKTCNSQSPETVNARLVTGGLLNSALLVTQFAKTYIREDISLTHCVEALQDTANALHNHDIKGVETLLIAQALALDTMFAALARRASATMNQHLDAADKFMRLALKAQSQCRTTLETLANIKNPQPYIQHNRAQYQQVNNGAPLTPEAPPARENQKQTNELLDAPNAPERLDFSATQATIKTDQTMETVAS